MADTVPNPFYGSSPLGDALKNLGKVIMSGPTEAHRIYAAEQALKLQQGRTFSGSVADKIRSFNTPSYDARAVAADAIQSRDPALLHNLPGTQLFLSANTNGVADPRTTDAYVGAGHAMAGSPGGFAVSQANEMERARMKPVAVGGPTGAEYVRQDQSYGKPAVENMEQVRAGEARRVLAQPGGLEAAPQATQRFLGAESKTNPKPLNYLAPDGRRFITYDGVRDAQSGALLKDIAPGGGISEIVGTPEQNGMRPSVEADLQKQQIAGQRFQGLINHTRNLAQASPNNFGITGYVKGLAQDATQIAQNVAQGLGYKQVAEAVQDVQRRAVAGGVNPSIISGMFDPNLPALHTAGNLLIYSAAEALANQSGRSVSNHDVERFRKIAGDPSEWMSSQQKYLSKLEQLEQILGIYREVNQQNLRPGGGNAPVPQASPGGGVAPPPSAPPGAPQIREEQWQRGPDGRLMRVQ